MKKLTATQKFIAAIVTQALGVIFLGLLSLPFLISERDTLQWAIEGPDALGKAASILRGILFLMCGFSVTAVALFWAIVKALRSLRSQTTGLGENHVDWIVTLFLWFDIPVVFLLVCQQGGPTRSVLSAVFLLILGAQMAVDLPQNSKRVYQVLVGVAVCFAVSFLSPPASDKSKVLKAWITDFSHLAPNGYAVACALVVLVSLAVALLQIYVRCRFTTINGTEGHEKEQD